MNELEKMIENENDKFWLEIVICPRCQKNYCMRAALVCSCIDDLEICPECYEKEGD